MIHQNIKKHKLNNLIHTGLLLVSMAVLLGLLGWSVAGWAGVKFAVVAGIVLFLFTPALPSRVIMRAYGARPLHPRSAPRLYTMVETLSKRAGLERMPVLYFLPSPVLNAFASGGRENPAICVTEGLLNILNGDETAAILGHEIAHIQNNDMRVMGYAELFGKLTGYGSLIGQALVILLLPSMLAGYVAVSFLPYLLLVFAPLLSTLMQLALSRTREFEADLGSSILTGSPHSLVSALHKLEMYRGRHWKNLFIPASLRRQPSMLRTHPSTKERIRRLLSLSASFRHQRAIAPYRGRQPYGLPDPLIRFNRIPGRYGRVHFFI